MADPQNRSFSNLDTSSTDHYGQEWSRFTQERGWGTEGLQKVFAQYFAPLPSGILTADAVVGDFGAGSGRWASIIAPLVSELYVFEPSPAAMAIAHRTLSEFGNVHFVEEPIGGPSVPNGELDLAYSIGVLHCIPNPEQALRDLRSSLKPGGAVLAYLYYALENRPAWFRAIWKASDVLRSRVSQLPASRKRWVTDLVATSIYWPLARMSWLLARIGVSAAQVPLSQYSDKSLYVMRNDALDRLGSPLEQRFTRSEISELLRRSGFDMSTLVFSEKEPFWCFSIRTPDNEE